MMYLPRETRSTEMEIIYPYIKPPWYTSIIQTRIEATKEEAKKLHDKVFSEHQKDPNTICLYTDRSGINNKIEAAVYCSTVKTTK
jgi:hypothetical protein